MRQLPDPGAYRIEWVMKPALLAECACWLERALHHPIEVDCESRDLARVAALACKKVIRIQQNLGDPHVRKLSCEVRGRFLLLRAAPLEPKVMTPAEIARAPGRARETRPHQAAISVRRASAQHGRSQLPRGHG
jgi:hypothetical protein